LDTYILSASNYTDISSNAIILSMSNYIEITSNEILTKINGYDSILSEVVSGGIFVQNIEQVTNIDIANIPYVQKNGTSLYCRSFDVTLTNYDTIAYSVKVIASYNRQKTFIDLSYHLYFAYYLLTKIVINGRIISFSDNTFEISGNSIILTPQPGFKMSIVSK
jgi:hypothetical protein